MGKRLPKITHSIVGKKPLRLDGIYLPKKGALTTARRRQCDALVVSAAEVLGHDSVDPLYIDGRVAPFIADFGSYTYPGAR